MSSVLLMNFLDVARSLGQDPLNATPPMVAGFIKREFRRTGGTFNYNSAIKVLPGLYSGNMSVEQAEDFCMSSGSPAGRVQNSNAVRIAGAYAVTQKSNCYKIPMTAVPVGRLSDGRTAFMSIKAPLVRVCHGKSFIVVPSFRLGHRPIGIEIDVSASFAMANFARGDFGEADFEYLDGGRGLSGERELQVHLGRDREIFDIDAVDYLLGVFVKGLELSIFEGVSAPVPNFKGYKIVDPDQPHML